MTVVPARRDERVHAWVAASTMKSNPKSSKQWRWLLGLSRPCTALNATRAASHILGTRSPATSAFAFSAQCVNHTSEKRAVHVLQTLHHLQPQVAASVCLRPNAAEVPKAFELELRLDVCLGHSLPYTSACASGHERCHKQLSCPTKRTHAPDMAAALSLLGCILLQRMSPYACIGCNDEGKGYYY